MNITKRVVWKSMSVKSSSVGLDVVDSGAGRFFLVAAGEALQQLYGSGKTHSFMRASVMYTDSV